MHLIVLIGMLMTVWGEYVTVLPGQPISVIRRKCDGHTLLNLTYSARGNTVSFLFGNTEQCSCLLASLRGCTHLEAFSVLERRSANRTTEANLPVSEYCGMFRNEGDRLATIEYQVNVVCALPRPEPNSSVSIFAVMFIIAGVFMAIIIPAYCCVLCCQASSSIVSQPKKANLELDEEHAYYYANPNE